MSTPRSEASPRRWLPRGMTIAWVSLAAVLGTIVVFVWATGGFGTDAKPYLGSRVEAGEMVETRFWDVAVHTAEVLPDAGEIRVYITAVNKERETTTGLINAMMVLRLPDGVPMTGATCTSERLFMFSPQIPEPGVCVFGFERNQVPPGSIPTGPFSIEVVVRDQELTDDLLTVPHPEAGEPVGWLPVTVSVAVEGER